MHDVITIGSSLVDVFIKSKDFQFQRKKGQVWLCQMYDQKQEIDELEVLTGGGGGNTAVGFSRAGFNTAVVSETGHDTLAQLILNDFHQEKVATNFIVQEKREQTGGSVIMVGQDGGRTVMVHRGASSCLDPHDIPMRAIKKVDWVHLASIAGRKFTLQAIAAALREGHANCSWNPGHQELRMLAAGKIPPDLIPCQILFVNSEEWKVLRPVQQALKRHIPEVIVTHGDKGGKAYIQGDRNLLHFPSNSKKCTDSTGAGDAFGVGYVTARIFGEDPEEACQWGVRNASSVIKYYGAKPGLLSHRQLSN